ncbi:hypothetical protein BJX76DRAFT_357679 [Aspergillus varians]
MRDRHSAEIANSFLDNCGIQARSGRHNKIWHLNQTGKASEIYPSFESLLQDYTLALFSPGDDPIPTRPRVDAILHHMLARAKREVQKPSDIATLKTVFWGYDQVISLPDTECDGTIWDCSLDYVLWYGDQRELETNLVVILDEKLTEGDGFDGYLPVLAAMSMIRYNQSPDSINRDMYGILTDGFKWMFLHLNGKNKYSWLELNWVDQQHAIVGQLGRIIKKSASLKLLCGESEDDEWGLTKQSIWSVQRRDCYSEDNQDLTTTDIDSEASSLVDSPQPPKMPRRSIFSFSIGRKKNGGQKSQQKRQLPTKAVTDLLPEDVEDIFGVERESSGATWMLHERERRNIPDHLKRLLNDYDLAFGKAEKNEAVVRARIDAIVLTTLAAKKREELGQHGGGKGSGKRTSTQSTKSYKSIHWGLERTLKLPWVVDGKKCLLTGKMDYALWYGRKEEAETNMVIVEAKRYGSHAVGRDQVIAYMAMLHHGRKKASRTNTAIYGIASDSYDWTFIRLSPQGTLSVHNLDWKDGCGAEEIVSHLHNVMDHAALLSPVPTQTLSRQQTVEELSGLSVE